MEVKQDDIFVSAKKATIINEKSKDVPIGYIPVIFSSGDKLSPEVLHFRNYTMEELFELASVKEDYQFRTLVLKALNNMVYEDFDCSQLHYENIKEIVIAIYKNFWGGILYNRPYYKDLKKLDDEDNIGYIDINLNLIKTIDIDPSFKNKISLIDSITKKKITFTLPKVEHLFIAEDTVKLLYSEKEHSYYDIKSLIELKEKLLNSNEIEASKQVEIDPVRKEEYESIVSDKNKDYYKMVQCQLIYAIDGVVLNTIEEKLNAFKNDVDANAWIEYKNIVEKYNFGINPNYEFAVNGEKLTRGFSFRPSIFIPTLDKKSNSRYRVQFDD